MTITSTSAEDTNTTGTGAHTLQIVGVDGNCKFLSETLNMSGQTPISTVGEFLRIFGISVLKAGTTLSNVGNIYCTSYDAEATFTGGVPDDLTAAWLKVLPGIGAATSGIFTVPAGETIRLEHLIAGARAQAVELYLFGHRIGDTSDNSWSVVFPVTLNQVTVSSNIQYLGLVIPEKTDLLFKAYGSSANGIYSVIMAMTRAHGPMIHSRRLA